MIDEKTSGLLNDLKTFSELSKRYSDLVVENTDLRQRLSTVALAYKELKDKYEPEKDKKINTKTKSKK